MSVSSQFDPASRRQVDAIEWAPMELRPDPRGPYLLVGNDVEIADDVEIGGHVVIHDGCRIGSGCRIGDGAVLGKRPVLSRFSTSSREPLPGLVIGEDCLLSTHAIVFAGSTLGSQVVVGDGALVRERCQIGDGSIIGRAATVENDTSVGARVKIQAHAYVTSHSLLEDDVFIAPCVVTTNDNFMGRTERRSALKKGPVVRRGARVGGGSVLLPGVEIGEEAFVGAGALVLRDVPARMVVVGSPTRPLREVPADELLVAADGTA
jgi:acetyltransferase-like isoleucine patch superfamily enzyme